MSPVLYIKRLGVFEPIMPSALGPSGPTGTTGPKGVTGATGITYRLAWNIATTYAVGDAVQYNGATYYALLAGFGQQPDTATTYWSVLAQKGNTGPTGLTGPQGISGVSGVSGVIGSTGVLYRAAWATGTTYAIGDIVTYAGSTWYAVLAGAAHQPDTSPTFWNLLAQAGVTGPTGPTGLTGMTGLTGPIGISGATGVTFRNVWATGTTYVVGDAVTYAGSSWYALLGGAAHPPDTSPTFWSLLAQAGITGPTGASGLQGVAGPVGLTGATGVLFRAQYGAAIPYVVGDVAYHAGSSWYAIQAGLGHQPDTSAAYWTLMAQMGATGLQGASGVPGGSGPIGAVGGSAPSTVFYSPVQPTAIYSGDIWIDTSGVF